MVANSTARATALRARDPHPHAHAHATHSLYRAPALGPMALPYLYVTRMRRAAVNCRILLVRLVSTRRGRFTGVWVGLVTMYIGFFLNVSLHVRWCQRLALINT